MVAVGRGHGACLLGGDVKGRLDALHPRVILQRLQCGHHCRLEGRVLHTHRLAAKHEEKGRPGAVLRKLILHQSDRASGLGVAPAVVLQRSAIEQRDDRSAQQERGDAEHRPAKPINELAPPGEHVRRPAPRSAAAAWQRRSPSHSKRRWPRRRRSRGSSLSAGRCRAGCPTARPRSHPPRPPADQASPR